MAFLLTPRALIESGSSQHIDTVPVTTLEQPDDCAWCVPIEPIDCENTGQPSEQPQRFWLNPDEPPRPQAPCKTAPDSEGGTPDPAGPNA